VPRRTRPAGWCAWGRQGQADWCASGRLAIEPRHWPDRAARNPSATPRQVESRSRLCHRRISSWACSQEARPRGQAREHKRVALTVSHDPAGPRPLIRLTTKARGAMKQASGRSGTPPTVQGYTAGDGTSCHALFRGLFLPVPVTVIDAESQHFCGTPAPVPMVPLQQGNAGRSGGVAHYGSRRWCGGGSSASCTSESPLDGSCRPAVASRQERR
jgi:hypothetical protein